MQPTRNNTGVAHENGAIESPHGHLKNRIKQLIGRQLELHFYTANQPFSQWDSLFLDSMMTVAAVDRLVHHGTIFDWSLV